MTSCTGPVSLADKALGVIEQRLEDGGARTAIWFLDRCLPSAQHKLSETTPEADMSSMEDTKQLLRWPLRGAWDWTRRAGS